MGSKTSFIVSAFASGLVVATSPPQTNTPDAVRLAQITAPAGQAGAVSGAARQSVGGMIEEARTQQRNTATRPKPSAPEYRYSRSRN